MSCNATCPGSKPHGSSEWPGPQRVDGLIGNDRICAPFGFLVGSTVFLDGCLGIILPRGLTLSPYVYPTRSGLVAMRRLRQDLSAR